MSTTTKIWIIWIVCTLIVAGILTYNLIPGKEKQKQVYLIGKMSDGHHQLKDSCESCHLSPFGGKEVLQKSCMNCHGKELADADDKHPKSKFTDPRNADRLEKLDARYCMTCHVEHKPKSTFAMGVTLPKDFCVNCHKDVGKERVSHKGLKFDTCQSAGCHNYHDNRSLYEDFLVKHKNAPAMMPAPQVVLRNFSEHYKKQNPKKAVQLTAKQADAPKDQSGNTKIQHDWLKSKHAQSGVNCSSCHQQKDKTSGTVKWTKKPGHQVCSTCHKSETKSFLAGKHGIKLKLGLAPMQPAQARVPMQAKAAHKNLTCNSCHVAHDYNTQHASTQACLGCHNDTHTLAFKKSPHYQLLQKELGGKLKPGSGVSCATCHMPRIPSSDKKGALVVVQHNQNANLRPNEKMIREVCMSCHGLRFSIDALASPNLIKNNFNGKPSKHIKGMDWAIQNDKKSGKKK